MLRRKALRKILITTFAIFTLFIVCLVTDDTFVKDLEVSKDVEYVTSLGMDYVYLLNNNNYLVRTNTLLGTDDTKKKISCLVDYLTIGKVDHLPAKLSALLPSNVKLLDIEIEENVVTLNFSKELWDGDSKLYERMIESLTYSVVSIDGISGLKLKVEGVLVTEIPSTKKILPEVLTKEYGINKVYDIDSTSNITKVTTYYLNKIDDQNYYVPVTKYVNDSREKVDIIVENLSGNFLYETNLISLLQNDIELMNYQIEDELMLLNFNNNLFNNEKFLEEVTYQVAYSIFDNYDVQSVLIEVNGEELTRIEK